MYIAIVNAKFRYKLSLVRLLYFYTCSETLISYYPAWNLFEKIASRHCRRLSWQTATLRIGILATTNKADHTTSRPSDALQVMLRHLLSQRSDIGIEVHHGPVDAFIMFEYNNT